MEREPLYEVSPSLLVPASIVNDSRAFPDPADSTAPIS